MDNSQFDAAGWEKTGFFTSTKSGRGITGTTVQKYCFFLTCANKSLLFGAETKKSALLMQKEGVLKINNWYFIDQKSPKTTPKKDF